MNVKYFSVLSQVFLDYCENERVRERKRKGGSQAEGVGQGEEEGEVINFLKKTN